VTVRRTTKPRVWSITPFLNEIDLLEVRLRELEGVVDVHVIAESPRTYAGAEKPLHFAEQRHRFDPWLDQIRYVVTTRLESVTHQRFGEHMRWQRENGQRAALAEGLDGLAPDDVVILSDVDEIPRRETVERYLALNEHRLIRPPLPMYLYRTGLRIVQPQASLLRLGRGSMLAKATPEDVRRQPTRPFPDRGQRAPYDAARWGWHMSYFGGVDAIRYKVAQAAHPEEDIAEWLEPAVLRECIAAGRDHRLNRHHALEAPDASTLPECIQADSVRFATLIDPLAFPAEYDPPAPPARAPRRRRPATTVTP